MKVAAALPVALILAACGTGAPVARPGHLPAPPPPVRAAHGLERVIGQSARGLAQLFGAPDAEVVEGPARKLQFGSRICVLDAYLYAQGRGEPLVTHIDTRQRDGSAIDRASCVAALSRREGGK